jgi:uncharacterized protein YaaN involved in tellurite resistance
MMDNKKQVKEQESLESLDQLSAASNEIVKKSEENAIEAIMEELDMHNRNSVMFFGSSAQEEIEVVSNKMLEGVKNKDLGSTGELLSDMVSNIKDFDIDALNPSVKKGFFASLFGGVSSIEKFINGYEDVRKQIDEITINLEQHKTTLLSDIVALDRLYEANMDYFNKLELYIRAGEEKLERIKSTVLPELESKAQTSTAMADMQNVKEARGFRDDLERRVHDLKLTHQVAMQSLPSMRLVQENDKALIAKIDSTIVNTVPLWKNQIAQTITIYRSGEAAKSIKEANDLTNDLLRENAKNLKEANKSVREQIERGVFDIEAVREANDTLIATLDESLSIAEEGKRSRAHAEKELIEIESDLKEALLATKAKVKESNTVT